MPRSKDHADRCHRCHAEGHRYSKKGHYYHTEICRLHQVLMPLPPRCLRQGHCTGCCPTRQSLDRERKRGSKGGRRMGEREEER